MGNCPFRERVIDGDLSSQLQSTIQSCFSLLGSIVNRTYELCVGCKCASLTYALYRSQGEDHIANGHKFREMTMEPF